MERKIYQLTEKQEAKIAKFDNAEIPSDEQFQEWWKKSHHGKLAGWGMGKRDWILREMKFNREYQMGLWQGALDKATGIEYVKDGDENSCYNLGYYRGYTGYESNRRGWDTETRANFDATYLN